MGTHSKSKEGTNYMDPSLFYLWHNQSLLHYETMALSHGCINCASNFKTFTNFLQYQTYCRIILRLLPMVKSQQARALVL